MNGMRDLSDEIRTAELRYYTGQLVAAFLSGTLVGTFVGWFLWG